MQVAAQILFVQTLLKPDSKIIAQVLKQATRIEVLEEIDPLVDVTFLTMDEYHAAIMARNAVCPVIINVSIK